MEWQRAVSEILVVLTVILIVVTVAYPLFVLAAQATGSRLGRMRGQGVRKALRRLWRGTIAVLGCVLPFQRQPAYFEAKPRADRRSRARGAASRSLSAAPGIPAGRKEAPGPAKFWTCRPAARACA